MHVASGSHYPSYHPSMHPDHPHTQGASLPSFTGSACMPLQRNTPQKASPSCPPISISYIVAGKLSHILYLKPLLTTNPSTYILVYRQSAHVPDLSVPPCMDARTGSCGRERVRHAPAEIMRKSDVRRCRRCGSCRSEHTTTQRPSSLICNTRNTTARGEVETHH